MIADGINPSIFYNRNDSVSIEIQTLKEDIEEELKTTSSTRVEVVV
ncbi:hypothetical protein ABQG68_11555 [Bacillus pumilus]